MRVLKITVLIIFVLILLLVIGAYMFLSAAAIELYIHNASDRNISISDSKAKALLIKPRSTGWLVLKDERSLRIDGGATNCSFAPKHNCYYELFISNENVICGTECETF